MRDCPEAERNYHGAIGGFVLITATAAALSGGYALYTVFRSVPLAIGFGLFWGLTIGAIDRFVVMTIDLSSHESRFRTLLAAGSRLLLAVFVAFVVARPLELRIFEPEISGHLQGRWTQRLEAEVAQIRTELEQQQLAYEGNRRLADERARHAELATESSTCRADELELRAATHGECDGTLGTRRVGVGPICDLKRIDLEAVKARCAGLEERLAASDATTASLEAENERVFGEMRAAAEARIAAAERDTAAQIAAIGNGQSGSLLTRLDALYAVSSQSSGAAWTVWFVTILFVAIETLPVGLKLMVAGRGNYAARIAADERESAKRHRIERRSREHERKKHRAAMHVIADAVREQQRTKVLRTVAHDVDMVTNEVNEEIRWRTEVASKDLAEPRSAFPEGTLVPATETSSARLPPVQLAPDDATPVEASRPKRGPWAVDSDG